MKQKKIKDKIVKIIKKHNHNRSMSLAEIEALITLKQIKNWQSKWDNILTDQILAEIKMVIEGKKKYTGSSRDLTQRELGYHQALSEILKEILG